jgi:hypothetical protein
VRILFVETTPGASLPYQQVLRAPKWSIAVALASAPDFDAAHRPEAIVLEGDFRHAGAIVRKLRSTRGLAHVPIVGLASGPRARGGALDAAKAGCDLYLDAPSSPIELGVTLEALVGPKPVVKGAPSGDFSSGSLTAVRARDEMPTLTDPEELEQARQISMFTSPPPALEASVAEIAEDDLGATREVAIASLAQVPKLVVSREAVSTLSLEPKAAFVIGLIDGTLCVEDLIDATGMSSQDTLTTLDELMARGIVELGAPIRDNAARTEQTAAIAFHVIAEGDDSIGGAPTLGDALAMAERARADGKRRVAIMEVASGQMIDEAKVRARDGA